jgi:hypothetical protein
LAEFAIGRLAGVLHSNRAGGNMQRTRIAAALATAALAGSVISAQTTSSAQANQSTTLIGCVYHEKDVPGRAPNVAERVGVLEDYILAEISPAEAAKPTGTTGSAANRPMTYSMYKLEKASDSELKAMVGKRVEVTGRIDADASDASGQPPASAQTNKTDKVVGHDRINLPEFEVSSIRSTSGTCPEKPSTSR